MIKKILNKALVKIIPSSKRYVDGMYISKELILKYLPSNPVIIDCGAHVGHDTLELAQIKNSEVYALEAVKDLYLKLVENTKESLNVKCFNIALSNVDGEADMHVSGGDSDGSSSLLKPKDHLIDHPEVSFDKTIRVNCMKLDSWAAENKVSSVDLLWLDMQGFEQQMLMASKTIFKTVSVIHTEVSTKETYEGVETYIEYKKFLLNNGFKVIAEAIPQGYDMGNVLFFKG